MVKYQLGEEDRAWVNVEGCWEWQGCPELSGPWSVEQLDVMHAGCRRTPRSVPARGQTGKVLGRSGRPPTPGSHLTALVSQGSAGQSPP